jgi:hypothetical protein
MHTRYIYTIYYVWKYSSAPVFAGYAFQDLLRLRETAYHPERYM